MSEESDPFRSREERAAHNQALFRAVNEPVRALNENLGLTNDSGPMAPVSEWVCECANPSCIERVEMSGQEYTAIRSAGNRFLVAPDEAHVHPDVELIADRRPTYWIVEKTGAAKIVAEKLDPTSA
jgi:hypothetical protein